MSSDKPLLAASSNLPTSPSFIASPPAPSGLNCLCPNPSLQSSAQASRSTPSTDAPFSFELLSFPPSDHLTPAFTLPPPTRHFPSPQTALRSSGSGAIEPHSSSTGSRSEPHPAVHSSTEYQLRPSRSAQERRPHSEHRFWQSRSVDERFSSSLRQLATSQPVEPSLELSNAALRTQSSLKQGSGSLDRAVDGASQSGVASRRLSEPRSGSIAGSGRRDPDKRVVFINNPEQTNERYEYTDNRVRTSKYTVFSFLPRNLFEQFHRVAYIYFLVIVCLNQIPQLAVFGRTASLFPLLIVLIITAIKDGYEDWRRSRSDMKENNRSALVLQDSEYRPKPWKHIRVGEMVKVQANETIPCDLVLLSTSDANGMAYVQTINLDGESNLKPRYARQETAAKHPELGPVSGRVICEKPNRNIYGFTAFLELESKQLALGPTNIILRGCELKNTSWAVGVAVYAGQETKAMLNSSGPQSKRSRLEQNMNREILWLTLFLLAICFIGGLGMGLWLRRHSKQLDYLPYYRKKFLTTWEDYNYYGVGGESIFAFLSFLITFQIMIPISLYISMELVRVGQSYFMIRDIEMFHTASNTRFQCRALNINEDLGQIRYVFSDKTGTLTENKMEFRNASIFGVNYSSPKAIVASAGDVEGSIRLEDKDVVKEVLGNQAWKPKAGVKIDPNLVRLLQASPDSLERKVAHDYLLTLAACNTVVPTKVKMTRSGNLEMEVALATDEGMGLVEYQGESPDEQALVSAAASYGYTLLERTSNHVVINVLGEIQRFQVLGLHEFDSVRKCMSMVLGCPDRTIKVLVKGADTSVISKVALGPDTSHMEDSQHAALIFATQMHVDLYSREGLRTLLVAAKDLTSAELKHWQKLYAKASTALGDRVGMMHEAAKAVEKDLMLLGATGIEDKLQAGVPDTIAALREAGIKVWVLTGDKQETAISIGLSCALLTDDMQQIIINESDKNSCREALVNAKATYVMSTEKRRSFLKRQNSVDATIQDAPVSSELFSASMSHSTFSASVSQSMAAGSFSGGSKILERELNRSRKGRPLALIIDGNSLVHALEEDLKQELFELATACKVVLCCRVAPLQKAGIVSLVKEKSREMTLAIGDGANDVSMIQMADVGVGISGQEGRQAVMASDFAMAQFRFLKRLLLVHGHWNYSRLGYMVLYNFYRNAVFVMLLFWYILYTAFSPSPAITEWSLVFFSLIYTSVPTIVVAIIDKDVSHTTLLKYPGLYKSGQRGESYSRTLFWLTMLDTLWQSLVLFYVPVLTYRISTIDIWGMGSVWTISVVLLVNLHLGMDTQHWIWICHLANWGSTAATFICLFILDMLQDENSLRHYWVIFHTVRTACYWLDIFLIVCLALLPRFIFKVAKQRFWPSDIQIAREEEILKRNETTAQDLNATCDSPLPNA